MLYYLFSIDQAVKYPLPFNIELFKYEPIDKKLYYVLQIDEGTIKILDDNNNVLSSGKMHNDGNTIKFYLDVGKLTFAGGTLSIKGSDCELIINGSGLPYIEAYRGTLKKLLKKEENKN